MSSFSRTCALHQRKRWRVDGNRRSGAELGECMCVILERATSRVTVPVSSLLGERRTAPCCVILLNSFLIHCFNSRLAPVLPSHRECLSCFPLNVSSIFH